MKNLFKRKPRRTLSEVSAEFAKKVPLPPKNTIERKREMTLEQLSNKLYESKLLHDYKDGKIDYRTIHQFIVDMEEEITFKTKIEMTPKEKAKELFDKYATYVVMWTGGIEVENQNCKQCALIAVDEIINNDGFTRHDDSLTEYWQEVKQEIKNL